MAEQVRELGLTPSLRKVPTKAERDAVSATNLNRYGGESSSEWKLLYWPYVLGRGEYVRLIFAAAGVEWEVR